MRHRVVVCLVGVVSTTTTVVVVDTSFECQITIALYDVLEGQLMKGRHLLEDERVVTILIRVE